MVLPLVVIVLFIFYSLLIFYYWKNWKLIPVYTTPQRNPTTRISVIVPARNEERNICTLLQALQQQTYPHELTEIIVIDDHSTDRTAELIRQFSGVKLLQLDATGINSYKKKAIETGITAATGDLIVTTDADCIPPPGWLQTIAACKEERNSVFIVAPVQFTITHSLLSIFQELDFLVLQGITGASVYKNLHSMCNGANLAYEKKAFYEVGGFTGIDKIASGDDMLLMYKIWKQFPSRVHYLKSKDAIVSTAPMKTWKDFFNQRIRWASKAKSYDDKRIFIVLLLVYLFNLSFLVLLIAGYWDVNFLFWLLGLWFAKTIVELPFVYAVAGFFSKRRLLRYFFFFQPLHILYTILSGLLGQFGKYEWKGRKVN